MKDKCDKDCKSCDFNQRSYCSTQMAIKNQDMIAEILTIIKSMNEKKEKTLISINDSENIKENENEIP